MRRFAPLLLLALLLGGCLGGDEAGRPGGSPLPGPAPSTGTPVEVGGAPVGVAVGEGGVWVIENRRGRLLRIDPRTERVTHRLAVGPAPVGVAVGDGAVWVAGGDGTLRRVDGRNPSRAGPPIRVPDPAGVAVGAGSVWVTSSERNAVLRFDSATGRRRGEPIRVGRRPTDLALGAGAVWVAGSNDGTVTRIDARSGKADAPVEVAREQVLGLTFGEGRVWVAKTEDFLPGRPVEVAALDPESTELEGASVQVEAGLPVRLAAGLGSVWVTQVGGVRFPGPPRPGSVARIDPRERRLRGAPARVGERPVGIAVGEGGVWVAASGDGTVTRVRP